MYLSAWMIGLQLLFEQAWKHSTDASMLESQTTAFEQLDVMHLWDRPGTVGEMSAVVDKEEIMLSFGFDGFNST